MVVFKVLVFVWAGEGVGVLGILGKIWAAGGGVDNVVYPLRNSPQDPNRQLRLARAIELRIVMGGVYVVCCSSNGPKHYLHPQLNRGQWCAPDTTFR